MNFRSQTILLIFLSFIFINSEIKAQDQEAELSLGLEYLAKAKEENGQQEENVDKALEIFLGLENWKYYVQALGVKGIHLHVKKEMKEALIYLDAADSLITTYNLDSLDLVRIYMTKADVFSDLGEFDKAENHLEHVIGMAERKGDSDLSLSAKLKLGRTYTMKADYKNSIPLFEELLRGWNEKKYKIINREDSSSLALTYEGLGLSNSRIGKFDKGIEYNLKALDINLQIFGEIHSSVDFNYRNIGDAYMRTGALDKALLYFKKSANVCNKLYGEKSPRHAMAMLNIGAVYYYMEELKETVTVFEQVLEVYEKSFGENHMSTARILSNLASVHSALGNYEEATIYAERSLPIFQQLLPNGSMQAFRVYSMLGSINRDQGNLEKAESYSKQSFMELERFGYKGHPDILGNYTLLGLIQQDQGKYEEAAQTFQEALIYASNDFKSTDLMENPVQGDLKFKWGVLNHGIIFNKARSLELLHDKNSNEEYLKMAVATSNLGNEVYYDLRKEFGSQEFANNDILSEVAKVDLNGIWAGEKLYHLSGEKQYFQEAFNFSERRKAAFLTEAVKNSDAKLTANIPADLLRKEKDLENKIQGLETNLYSEEGLDSEEKLALEDTIFNLKQELEAFNNQFREQFSEYFQFKNASEVVAVEKIQEYLNDESIFIEYAISSEFHKELMIFLIENNEEHVIKVPLKEGIERKITRLNRLLRGYNLNRRDRKSKFVNLSNELYQQFVQPITNYLNGKRKIIIVGEGVTNYLPFEVLVSNEEIKPFEELEFLVKDFEISYQYSGTLFVQSKERALSYKNDLLAFAPVFGDPDVAAIQNEGFRSTMDSIFRSVKDNHFEPLYKSEEEVKNIVNLFDKEDLTKNKLLTYKEAGEASLKNALENNYRFVHIASHSFANIDSPNFSGIACAQLEENEEDGIIYVGEIYNLRINSDLVVLSSCESGIGKVLTGEGMLGLNRSFVYAGVPNVVFSLWKVYDHISSELMINFYKGVLENQSYAAALRNAKLEMLEKAETASPEFWGAFLLIGN